VVALLLFSTTQAYRIQGSLSDEALQIYHRHVRQDDLLWRLRRSLWLGANSARDFLLNPHADRDEKLASQLAALEKASADRLQELAIVPGSKLPPRLRSTIDEYWQALRAVPDTTAKLNAAGRYAFVHDEIVARRNVVGDLVREFTQLGQVQLQESEVELARSRRDGANHLLWILGLSVIVAVVVAGFSLAHSESLERQTVLQYEEVERARTELQQFAARLMQIQEEERTRLSRDLHDEIGQALATLRLEVARAESVLPKELPELRESLVRARKLAERTVQNIRDISTLLRPSLLDDLGLQPALEWQVEDFTRRTGVPCELRHEGSYDALPEAVRTCVYRVIQESLHNCEKHAAASQATVSIFQSSAEITVVVQDDGKGFDGESEVNARRLGRFGILGMRERATVLGGSLEVVTSLGAGVRLSLHVPLEKPSETDASLKHMEVTA
jgi:signal transduction histidine kinase